MMLKYKAILLVTAFSASAPTCSGAVSPHRQAFHRGAVPGFALHQHRPRGRVIDVATAARPRAHDIETETAPSLHRSDADSNERGMTTLTRRESLMKALSTASASFILSACVTPIESANAFPNKISDKYDDRPKQRGAQPKDLGIANRKDMFGGEHAGLKSCSPAPNCFCSTDSSEDDPIHNIPPWKWPASAGGEKNAAFLQLREVVEAYVPGQGNIDGGGFQIAKFDPQSGYLYAQFQSLKNGYIDDLEFAFVGGRPGEENAVQVRSSSRLGYLDYGVNAKRLNYIAKALREKGWDAPGVDMSSHPLYAEENRVEV